MSLTVACPNCKRPVPWGPASPFRPFCCERCRLIDLGEWFDETHRIPGPAHDDQADDWIDDDQDAANGDPRSLPH